VLVRRSRWRVDHQPVELAPANVLEELPYHC
jgi:hypothetical protein